MQDIPEDLQAKIIDHYQHGQGSIQDIARVYNVPVYKVMDICGMGDLQEVEMIGDQVDQSELGRSDTVKPGEIVNVPISLN